MNILHGTPAEHWRQKLSEAVEKNGRGSCLYGASCHEERSVESVSPLEELTDSIDAQAGA